MLNKTWKFSVYLLQDGTTLEEAFSKKVDRRDYTELRSSHAKIAIGSSNPYTPKWADLFKLSADEANSLETQSTYCILLLFVEDRWFAITWGLGHTKLNNDKIVQDFGRRVLVNAVNPEKLKGMDSRTVTVNALNQRSQISRATNQTAFDIDTQCVVLRALGGKPKETTFANSIHGATAMTITCKAELADLPELCRRALVFYGSKVYLEQFSWINNFTSISDQTEVQWLQNELIETLTKALQPGAEVPENIALAYPIIYDPECGTSVKFRGYRSQTSYPDLEIDHYLTDLRANGYSVFKAKMLKNHKVQEWDVNRRTGGRKWNIKNCLVFEKYHNGNCYMHFDGRWHGIAKTLLDNAKECFFKSIKKDILPQAKVGDNEKTYNKRCAADTSKMLSLDGKLVTPTDAKSTIELCDFFGVDKSLIHIKNKPESSNLSHQFNQGYVSALTLKNDGNFRDEVRSLIDIQPGGAAYAKLIPRSDEVFTPSGYTVVFGVLVKSAAHNNRKLPFFSLMTFQQTKINIEKLGFKVVFTWIEKKGVIQDNKVVSKENQTVSKQINAVETLELKNKTASKQIKAPESPELTNKTASKQIKAPESPELENKAASEQTGARKRPKLEDDYATSNQFKGLQCARRDQEVKRFKRMLTKKRNAPNRSNGLGITKCDGPQY